MAINLSQLSNATTAATALSNLILVTPKQIVGLAPQNAPTYAGNQDKPSAALLFNYTGEERVSLQSDITDHYIENNTAIQDMISLKPVTYTVSGFVGELNDIAPAALQPLKIAAEKLTTIGGYVPQLTTTAQLAYVNALQLYQVGSSLVNSAVSAWSSINGGNQGGVQTIINGSSAIAKNETAAGITSARNGTQNKQQIYFQQLYGYWENRTLFTVQTPWAVFQDMAILNLSAVQDAETEVITDFEITFKLMRFASTLTSQGQANGLSSTGRAKASAANVTNLGTFVAVQSPVSFLSGVA